MLPFLAALEQITQPHVALGGVVQIIEKADARLARKVAGIPNR